VHELAQSSDHRVQKRRLLQEQNLEGVEAPNRTIGFKFDGRYFQKTPKGLRIQNPPGRNVGKSDKWSMSKQSWTPTLSCEIQRGVLNIIFPSARLIAT
jgi:hypothetical protein